MAHSIVFFGTHDFAATVLSGLLANPFFKVELVITQPDRPVGRKKILTPPPVKVLAENHGLMYLQPESLKNFEFPDFTPEFGIVAQYGNIVPKRILDWPEHGMINTHTSLLPKYRGASPVQAALLNGDQETGLTIMQMDPGLDTGPILVQEKITINPDDRCPDVEKKLAALAVPNLEKALQGLINNTITPQAQNNGAASVCGKLDRDSGRINWSDSVEKIYNTFRALYPWPGIWTTWEGARLKLLDIRPTNKLLAPGQVQVEKNQLLIGCGNGTVEILSLQPEGKTALAAKDFLVGYRRIDGITLE